MDDFYLQPHQRTTKRLREPGGNVDYERFETEVLQPMLTGEAFSYRPYDAHAVCFLPEVIVLRKSDDHRGFLCLSSETAQKL